MRYQESVQEKKKLRSVRCCESPRGSTAFPPPFSLPLFPLPISLNAPKASFPLLFLPPSPTKTQEPLTCCLKRAKPPRAHCEKAAAVVPRDCGRRCKPCRSSSDAPRVADAAPPSALRSDSWQRCSFDSVPTSPALELARGRSHLFAIRLRVDTNKPACCGCWRVLPEPARERAASAQKKKSSQALRAQSNPRASASEM